ncbi:MAG: Uma2 family endonuclease, partial [Planctomycetes bacterium]|nr:Uma2 family endonuclease [Planctomycetota bacterium]
PGGTDTGEMWCDLASNLRAVVKRRGWRISLDARHRLPHPTTTVVFPDIAIHAAREIECRPGTHTAVRVPDLVVEILSDETYERDMAPTGAKYLAYEASGVKEYYYTRPDGRDAAGFGLIDGRYQPLPQRQGGWFASPLLGRDFRLVPAATRKRRATKRRR